MSETEEFYQKNHQEFIDQTLNINREDIYQKFLHYIPKKSEILDIGCGSGRDSLYFKNQGLNVIAIDNNPHFVEFTKEHAGVETYLKSFQEIDYVNKFDAIWACASLLHCQKNKLTEIFFKLAKALKENGIIYTSFKYGTFSGIRSDRFFTDLNEELLDKILDVVNNLKIIEIWITTDKRKENAEKWLNILLRKVN